MLLLTVHFWYYLLTIGQEFYVFLTGSVWLSLWPLWPEAAPRLFVLLRPTLTWSIPAKSVAPFHLFNFSPFQLFTFHLFTFSLFTLAFQTWPLTIRLASFSECSEHILRSHLNQFSNLPPRLLWVLTYSALQLVGIPWRRNCRLTATGMSISVFFSNFVMDLITPPTVELLNE